MLYEGRPFSPPSLKWIGSTPKKAIGRGKYFYKYKIGVSLDLYSVTIERLLLSCRLSYSCTTAILRKVFNSDSSQNVQVEDHGFISTLERSRNK